MDKISLKERLHRNGRQKLQGYKGRTGGMGARATFEQKYIVHMYEYLNQQM